MKSLSRKRSGSLIETLEGRTLFSFMYPNVPGNSPTETASASIVASPLTSTTYQYSITLTDTRSAPSTSTNQVGTLWFAWVPGEDFLDTAPLSVSSPTGWTEQVTHNGSTDGYSIQWVSSSNAVKAGKSLGGFVFTSSDTPTQVFGNSNFYPNTAVNSAFVYAGAPETDAGFSFTSAISILSTPPATPTGVETASANIVASQLTDTTYQYSLTLKNTRLGRQPTRHLLVRVDSASGLPPDRSSDRYLTYRLDRQNHRRNRLGRICHPMGCHIQRRSSW